MPTLAQSSPLHPRTALPSQPKYRSSSTATIITREGHTKGWAQWFPCHMVNSSLLASAGHGEREMPPRHREPREAARQLGKHLLPARPPPFCLCSTPARLLPRVPEPHVGGLATHSGSLLSSECLRSLALRVVSTACPWLFTTRTWVSGSSHFFNALCGPFNCCKIQRWLREQGLKPRTSSKLEVLLTSMSKVIEHAALPGEDSLKFFLTLTVFNADSLPWWDCRLSSSVP